MDLPYFKFYPAECMADEWYQGASLEARGAWLSLLNHAWVNGSIPSEPAELARILHVRADSFRRLWREIGSRFVAHPSASGRLTSTRLEVERESALARSEKARNSASAKYAKAQQSTAANAERTQSERRASALLGDQSSVAQRSAPQMLGAGRPAVLGVGSPAYVAATHWRDRVWPAMSPADCPDVTTEQAQSLAGLVAKHGEVEVLAAMDRAAADPFWRDKLDLSTFVTKFPRFLPRNASAETKDVRLGRMEPAPASAFIGGERDLTRI